MKTDQQPKLTDQEFLSRFEDLSLDETCFGHLGHIRLAWLYLGRYEVDTAVSRVCSGIDAYATSRGASTKFHFTITDALVRIIAQRTSEMRNRSWPAFVEENQDLVNDALSVLGQHFSRQRLFSEQARTSLVEPDLRPLAVFPQGRNTLLVHPTWKQADGSRAEPDNLG